MRHEFTSKIKQYYFGINAKGLINDLRVMEFPEEKYCGNIQIPEDFFGKGLLAADIFNERKCDATAAICFNDDMALGFAKRLRKIGYRIPEDISIVGFDGIYSRKYADTMMTSLCLNPKLHGAKCVEVLLNIINGKKVKHITNIPNYIEVGESVKKLNN